LGLGGMQPITIISVLIFLATYLVVALGRLPGLHVDRTGAALIGASLMVGIVNLSEISMI
jgi:hypothetical protein